MNIVDAFELIKRHLPCEVADRAASRFAESPAASEVSIAGFSLWRVKDAKNLAFILERRAATCPEHELRVALEKQHSLLSDALRRGTKDQLWQAYLASDEKHTSFILNVATGELAIS